MSLAESVAPETGAKPTLPEGVDRVVLNQQLELVFGGDNPKLEKRIRRNAANMVAGRGEARRGVDDSLDKHEAGKKAQELALIAGPAVFGAGVYVAEPNRLRLATESLFISGALIGPAVELTSGALKMLETKFSKLSGLAKLVSGVRSKAHLVSQMSAAAAAGFMGAGIVDALTPDVIVASGGDHAGRANLPPSPDRDLRGQPDVGKVPFGGVGPNDRGSGVNAVPQQPSAPEMPVKPGDLEQLPNLPDPAEAARIAALNQGQTVAELVKTMPQGTVSEAVHQIVGDVPHSLEIVNVIDRAAEGDVLKLHEGAIKELARVLSKEFVRADVAAAGLGVPYDAGGLAAARQAYGDNSSVVNAIKAANLPDQLEAAGSIRENIFRPILQGLAK